MKGSVSVIDNYNSGILNFCSVNISPEQWIFCQMFLLECVPGFALIKQILPYMHVFVNMHGLVFNIKFAGLFPPALV